jgi:crotonobetainyl-CoA:carnitine CoA-transferase CaiB-like acyl-CoA transferase
VCVDLGSEKGVELVRSLVPHVDVVVESFRPGVIAKIGFGYDVLRKLRSDIIFCSISAFGQKGPLADKPGYDYVAQAYAGVTSMIGAPGESPYVPAVALGDVNTGVHGALGILAALRHRDRTGVGQHVDVSLLDTYYHCHEVNVADHSVSGGKIDPMRAGRHMTYAAPAGVFRANGGDVVIMSHAQHWPDLCRAMDRAELADDPRFRNDRARLKNLDELVALIEDWLARFPDVASAVGHLERHRVPVAPILSVAETMRHPHLRQRGTVRTIEDPLVGRFDVPGMPIRFSEFPDDLALVTAGAGEHNGEVFSELLGLEIEELRELAEEGILGGEDSGS